MRIGILKTAALSAALCLPLLASAQKYGNGLIDKTVAVVGAEAITISDIEGQVQMMRAQGMASDRNARCEVLENMMESKIFLMQARVDSLSVNMDMVEGELSQQMDMFQSLIQQEQSQVASNIPELTPYDVKQYLDTLAREDIPLVPAKYQLSQIAIYPDREAANLAVKEKLLSLRERILSGEKFSTLARIYSEDVNSALRGGELGMASKSSFWPVFSDAAMSLKPGVISQIVETPDGFHIIEVLEKKGDMFNARHILIKPKYTAEDQEKAFAKLDSLRTEINNGAVSFALAARFYSEDPATRTNGGQMADPHTGSSYFEIDQLKPQDYAAIKDLKEGEISEPVASLDNEGRNGNTVYKIIRVDKILPSHPATFENDYTQLLEQVRHQKQIRAIEAFIDEKIKTTYIVIDPMYRECSFNREGWAEKFRAD